MDGWTDRRSDEGDTNIPFAFLKSVEIMKPMLHVYF